MLSPYDVIILSRDRYEERLREAARDQAFDRAVSQFVQSTLKAAGSHIAAPLNALMHRARHGRFNGVELRAESSAK